MRRNGELMRLSVNNQYADFEAPMALYTKRAMSMILRGNTGCMSGYYTLWLQASSITIEDGRLLSRKEVPA